MIKVVYEKYKNVIFEFVKFGIVGFINTINDYLTYRLCLYISIEYRISTTIGFIVSSIIGYLLQKKFVFKSKASKKESLVKFYVVYGSSLLLKLILVTIFVELLHVPKKYAPLLTMFITIPYNFILGKIWIYKERKQ